MRNRSSDHTSVCSAGIQSLWPTCASCSAASSSARDMSSCEPTVLARIGTAPYPRPATAGRDPGQGVWTMTTTLRRSRAPQAIDLTSSVLVPFGVGITTTSPVRAPTSAWPTGDSTDSLPWAASASTALTSV